MWSGCFPIKGLFLGASSETEMKSSNVGSNGKWANWSNWNYHTNLEEAKYILKSPQVVGSQPGERNESFFGVPSVVGSSAVVVPKKSQIAEGDDW